jgi:chemotaxis protein CheC
MSTPNTSVLGPLELDALTELVNLGVGRAAVNLREMVREQVHLSVPLLKLVNRAEATALLDRREGSKLVAVHQIFEGDIAGRVLLIFPEVKSLELVRAVTGGALSLEEIIELEQEALAETGNIILNGCMATIANLLERSLKMSMPEILRGNGPEFFALPPPPTAGDVVVFLHIDFSIKQRDINGYIVMLMDMPSIEALSGLLGEFIARTTDAAVPPPDARH